MGGRRGAYTKSVLEPYAANSKGLEELGHRLAAYLRVGSCSCWGVLSGREVRDALCGFDIDVLDCHFAVGDLGVQMEAELKSAVYLG